MINVNELEKICKLLKRTLKKDAKKAKLDKKEIDRRYYHSIRVARLCLELGQQDFKKYSLNNKDLEILFIAGLLHDISKFKEKLGKGNHAEIAYNDLPIFLKFKSEEFIYSIADIVSKHSDKKNYEFVDIEDEMERVNSIREIDNEYCEKYYIKNIKRYIMINILKEADIFDHMEMNYVNLTCGNSSVLLDKLISELEEYDKEKFSRMGKELYSKGMKYLYFKRRKNI